MKNKMQNMVTLLNRARNAYYNLAKPFMSDEEYDKRFDELKALEAETGIVLKDSPTHGVGYTVMDKLTKVNINPPMLSLDKTQDIKEFKKFLNVQDSFLMLKMDGLSVRLKYKNGVLVAANTRGNGTIGESILHNAKTFVNIPKKIDTNEELILDGEAIIDCATFERINSNLSEDEQFANPRNLVSGTVRQLDSKVCADRKVRFICWKVIQMEQDEDDFIARLKYAESLGFEKVYICYCEEYDDIDILSELTKDMKQDAEKLGYPIDGIVGKYRSEKYGQSLGSTAHHELCGKAFKFKDEAVETTLRDIEWSSGKTGVLCPVAIFDPVQIEGTMVSRASLHNLKRLRELQIGIGDKIGVVKRNMIIPDVAENLTRSDNYVTPIFCPYCDGIVDEDEQDLICQNTNCEGKRLGLLENFCGRHGMNIIGLSEATLEKLYSNKMVTKFSDIYNLNQYVDEIAHWDGFGKKSADKLMQAIEASKHVNFHQFISALGIPMIGISQGKVIGKYFRNDVDAFEEAANGTFSFTRLDNFGDTLNRNIHDWFRENAEEFRELKELMVFADTVTPTGDKLSGKTFCTTGKLNVFKNRDELVATVESNGGTYLSGVSKKLNYLISNETSESSKMKKARELGVEVITEADFLEMVK